MPNMPTAMATDPVAEEGATAVRSWRMSNPSPIAPPRSRSYSRTLGALFFLGMATILVVRFLLGSHSSERHLDLGLLHLIEALRSSPVTPESSPSLRFGAARDAFSTSAGNGLGASLPVLALELTDLLEQADLSRAPVELRPTLEALLMGDFLLARRRLTMLRDASAAVPPAQREGLAVLAVLLQRLVELDRTY